MKYRASLSSVLGLGLALASASSARADERVTVAATVRVHVVSSSKAVRLESRPPGESGWSTACESPCDRELPLADEYRMVDEATGHDAGKPFRLNAAKGAVELTFHPASVGDKVGGATLIVVGTSLAIISAVGLVVGLQLAAEPEKPCQTDSCFGVGKGVLGAGLALLSGIGILAGGGFILTGALVVEDGKATTTQKPWGGREPTWARPQAAAPRNATFAPLSFSF